MPPRDDSTAISRKIHVFKGHDLPRNKLDGHLQREIKDITGKSGPCFTRLDTYLQRLMMYAIGFQTAGLQPETPIRKMGRKRTSGEEMSIILARTACICNI